MRVFLGIVFSLALVVASATLETEAASSSQGATAACAPARVNYSPYPGADRQLKRLPWVRGKPSRIGLVGLLWYWPESWQQGRVRPARIFTGGTAPGGHSTKILWVFLGGSAKGRAGARLVVRGRRLDRPGRFRQEFVAISYAAQQGAPSYASIVDIPSPGCWRLELSTGRLRAQVVFRAVEDTEPSAERPTLCSADEVEALVDRFTDSFDGGRFDELDGLFAREPEFEWYSTDAPGERLSPLAYDRASLLPHFRERHSRGENLTLHSFAFTGNTNGARTYGNFVYTLTRRADDLEATPYRGKGAALCYRNRPDVIFVWSMGRMS